MIVSKNDAQHAHFSGQHCSNNASTINSKHLGYSWYTVYLTIYYICIYIYIFDIVNIDTSKIIYPKRPFAQSDGPWVIGSYLGVSFDWLTSTVTWGGVCDSTWTFIHKRWLKNNKQTGNRCQVITIRGHS